MNRVWIVVVVLLVASCDPLVHDTFRVSPRAGRADAPTAARPLDVLGGVDAVARRFGLQPTQAQSDGGTRNWSGPVEANAHTRLSVRAVRAADGRVTVTVGEMFTNRWSPRGDSLRRAVADTLRVLGADTP
jgi:hypothetical protein